MAKKLQVEAVRLWVKNGPDGEYWMGAWTMTRNSTGYGSTLPLGNGHCWHFCCTWNGEKVKRKATRSKRRVKISSLLAPLLSSSWPGIACLRPGYLQFVDDVYLAFPQPPLTRSSLSSWFQTHASVWSILGDRWMFCLWFRLSPSHYMITVPQPLFHLIVTLSSMYDILSALQNSFSYLRLKNWHGELR